MNWQRTPALFEVRIRPGGPKESSPDREVGVSRPTKDRKARRTDTLPPPRCQSFGPPVALARVFPDLTVRATSCRPSGPLDVAPLFLLPLCALRALCAFALKSDRGWIAATASALLVVALL